PAVPRVQKAEASRERLARGDRTLAIVGLIPGRPYGHVVNSRRQIELRPAHLLSLDEHPGTLWHILQHEAARRAGRGDGRAHRRGAARVGPGAVDVRDRG